MPKVTMVKKARKDYPDYGIKKGESYYWWAFRFGGKRFSKTYPKRSQLTQSSFLSQLYDIEDSLSEVSGETAEDLESAVNDIISEIESLRDETQEKLDNMPQQLQDADTGQLLQERIDGLENWISELQSIDFNVEEELSEEEKKEAIEKIVEEIQSTSAGL